jgi:hypothetical protein
MVRRLAVFDDRLTASTNSFKFFRRNGNGAWSQGRRVLDQMST